MTKIFVLCLIIAATFTYTKAQQDSTATDNDDTTCVEDFYINYYKNMGVPDADNIAFSSFFLGNPVGTQAYEYLISREVLFQCNVKSCHGGPPCDDEKADLKTKYSAVQGFLEFIKASKQNQEALQIISHLNVASNIADLSKHVSDSLKERYCATAGQMKGSQYVSSS